MKNLIEIDYKFSYLNQIHIIKNICRNMIIKFFSDEYFYCKKKSLIVGCNKLNFFLNYQYYYILVRKDNELLLSIIFDSQIKVDSIKNQINYCDYELKNKTNLHLLHKKKTKFIDNKVLYDFLFQYIKNLNNKYRLVYYHIIFDSMVLSFLESSSKNENELGILLDYLQDNTNIDINKENLKPTWLSFCNYLIK
jgi:hypothetical protein